MQLAKSRSVIPGLTFVESIDSTNAELARNHASLGDFTVLIAGEQTSGQGRAGRNWVSMPGDSIAVSFLLRPARIEVASLVTLMAAASAHQALMHLFPSVSFSIKWPNDILIAERKLAGILAQRNEDGSVVCGIGINLSGRGFSSLAVLKTWANDVSFLFQQQFLNLHKILIINYIKVQVQFPPAPQPQQ